MGPVDLVLGVGLIIETLLDLTASKDPLSAPTCGLPAVEAGLVVIAEILASGNAAGSC